MIRAQPESRLQQAMVIYLRARGFFVAHVPNGNKLSGSAAQRARTGARLRDEGAVAGFPDLLVYAGDGRIGHIEVKSAEGQQQATQKACQGELEKRGHHYAVCRSIDDVNDTLGRWGFV